METTPRAVRSPACSAQSSFGQTASLREAERLCGAVPVGCAGARHSCLAEALGMETVVRVEKKREGATQSSLFRNGNQVL